MISEEGTDTTPRELDRDILALIEEGAGGKLDEARFNTLALRVFVYQFQHNPVYAAFCARRGITPITVWSWMDIPALPTLAFKEMPLACFPVEKAEAVFLSSGTSGAARSKHHLESLRLYHASLLASFKAFVLPDRERAHMLFLAPPASAMPQSSLTHMFEVLKKELGEPGSAFYVEGPTLQAERLLVDLRRAEAAGEPLCLLGASFAFVHFLDFCAQKDARFQLPAGSRIMDTGGFKGRSREVPKDQLRREYERVLGIPERYVVNEYGMTEMGSQFYDNCLSKESGGKRRKLVPPWVRTLVIDPETMQPVSDNRPGLLRHHDLVNRGSVMAIQTDDIGVAVENGFEVLGRARDSEARGCSIAIDEMLSRGG